MVPLFLHIALSAVTRVCVTLDSGFEMLNDPTIPIDEVSHECQLHGFNVEARLTLLPMVLQTSTYQLRVLGSYGELMVATRRGECDVGWAAYFHTSNRDQCGDTVLDVITCRPLSELNASQLDSTGWGPWRCCVDFSPPFTTYGLAIMYDAQRKGFLESLYQSITHPFNQRTHPQINQSSDHYQMNQPVNH